MFLSQKKNPTRLRHARVDVGHMVLSWTGDTQATSSLASLQVTGWNWKHVHDDSNTPNCREKNPRSTGAPSRGDWKWYIYYLVFQFFVYSFPSQYHPILSDHANQPIIVSVVKSKVVMPHAGINFQTILTWCRNSIIQTEIACERKYSSKIRWGLGPLLVFNKLRCFKKDKQN